MGTYEKLVENAQAFMERLEKEDPARMERIREESMEERVSAFLNAALSVLMPFYAHLKEPPQELLDELQEVIPDAMERAYKEGHGWVAKALQENLPPEEAYELFLSAFWDEGIRVGMMMAGKRLVLLHSESKGRG